MKKTLITILCTVLVCSCVMGATLAFLMDKTDSITNTFTVGDIEITLEETGATNGAQSFKLLPGNTYTKDPTVTVIKDSEDCWLFIKVDKSTDFDKYIDSAIVDEWTSLDGVPGVYYREVAKNETDDQEFPVLEGNTVTVKSTLTNADMENLADPTITFTAYAVQKDTVVATAADAWVVANTGDLPKGN